MISPVFYHYYDSPVGRLLLIAQDQALIGIEFEQEQLAQSLEQMQPSDQASGPIQAIFCKTQDILAAYFAGGKLDFAQLDFLKPKGTAFQQAVWQKLREIPYGQTTSYGEIANQLGKPKAMRAVGGAVGRNPISILVPCHRVLGKSEALTGFGGGLPAKRYLLNLEGIGYKDRGMEFVQPKGKKWA
ncbi:cysteine methyltransferase [Pasteurellaceae bacterium RH1A]|nr:cysteine methyltransferase [Pasteurellaceae bacterium RH1A]